MRDRVSCAAVVLCIQMEKQSRLMLQLIFCDEFGNTGGQLMPTEAAGHQGSALWLEVGSSLVTTNPTQFDSQGWR
jgi:hypothetical protein